MMRYRNHTPNKCSAFLPKMKTTKYFQQKTSSAFESSSVDGPWVLRLGVQFIVPTNQQTEKVIMLHHKFSGARTHVIYRTDRCVFKVFFTKPIRRESKDSCTTRQSKRVPLRTKVSMQNRWRHYCIIYTALATAIRPQVSRDAESVFYLLHSIFLL